MDYRVGKIALLALNTQLDLLILMLLYVWFVQCAKPSLTPLSVEQLVTSNQHIANPLLTLCRLCSGFWLYMTLWDNAHVLLLQLLSSLVVPVLR